MKSKTSSAIIICGGAPKPYLSHLETIKEAASSVIYIGVDGGASKLVESGIKLDYAIGDFDSVSIDEYARIKQATRKMITYPSAKDDTDFELALSLIIEENLLGEIYIYGAMGSKDYGRMDHLISNLWMVYQLRFASLIERVHFIEKNHQLEFLLPGEHVVLPVHWVNYLSIISLTAVTGLAISGAKYQLPATDYAYPRALISNEFIENKKVTITFKSGLILVMYVREKE